MHILFIKNLDFNFSCNLFNRDLQEAILSHQIFSLIFTDKARELRKILTSRYSLKKSQSCKRRVNGGSKLKIHLDPISQVISRRHLLLNHFLMAIVLQFQCNHALLANIMC